MLVMMGTEHTSQKLSTREAEREKYPEMIISVGFLLVGQWQGTACNRRDG